MNVQAIISEATKSNWTRLNSNVKEKLTRRANKRLSVKNIIPIEYLANKNNISIVNQITSLILKNKWNIKNALYSVGINLFTKNNLRSKPYIKKVLNEYPYTVIPELIDVFIPNEFDFLGTLYQSLLLEGEKNTLGSYYTPYPIIKNMVYGLDFSNRETFLDPCCGSGAFLLSLNCPNPNQIYGIDNDPIAVMLAKFNLLLKYNTHSFYPQIFNEDYLSRYDLLTQSGNSLTWSDQKFDYIFTNPPWGAAACNKHFYPTIQSQETFSCFFVRSWTRLKEDGEMRFLFPESILKVKTHRDIRNFILQNCLLKSITIYENIFTGVTTSFIDIHCKKNVPQDTVQVYHYNQKSTVSLASFKETDNNVFNLVDDEKIEIVRHIKSLCQNNLKSSQWGLGIVTGDNKNKLKDHYIEGYEEVYTGKEIEPYCLQPAKKYIFYDRKQFQQVAKDEIYRAEEKLVYKFVSNKLVFAYDNKQRLFINSANILIPDIPGMSIKTVLSLLNSDVYQFLYQCLFGEIKILKGNLMELPFPDVSPQDNQIIEDLVDSLLQGKKEYISNLQNYIYQIFGLNKKQIKVIQEFVYGKIDG